MPTFSATLILAGTSATGIEVPAAVVDELGSSRKPAVTVTIAGYSYRSTVASRGGVFMVPVSAAVRAGAGVAAGEEVDVMLELDTEPREVIVPPDLAAALDGDAQAKTFFDGLSYSNRRRLVLAIEGAKAAETRARRVAKTVSALHEGRV